MNTYSPKSKFTFIGKKRETKQKYVGIKTIKEKTSNDKVLFCLNCSWKFPDRMSTSRRNIHVIKCFEGKGKLDIMLYNEEQKLKLLRKISNKKIKELITCPICGKDLKGKSPKKKQTHLNDCSKLSVI